MPHDFALFLHAMRRQRLLHLIHHDADCDALGSAYTLSRVLPGEIGTADGMKTSAADLAGWLEIEPLINPDPQDFEYVIIHDTYLGELLGMPLPPRYALIDHHITGGHRFFKGQNQLQAGAEWHWVQPLESTCSLLFELLGAQQIIPDHRMQIALAAGLVTDTVYLSQADSAALRRLAAILEPGDLRLADVLEVIDNPGRKAMRRAASVRALHNLHDEMVNGWAILATETDSQDNGFAILAALRRLGGDICMVSFPHKGQAMIMLEGSETLLQAAHLDISLTSREIARTLNATDAWGQGLFGRIIAPLSPQALLQACIRAIQQKIL